MELEQLGVGHSIKNDTGFIPGHSWKVYGAVTVKCGDDVIVERAPNHFVNQGLRGIMCIFTNYAPAAQGTSYTYAWSWSSGTATIMLGHDTVTPTTYATTALTNQESTVCIGYYQSATTSNGTNGYYVRRISVWAPNAFAGSVGEMGLFLRAFNNLAIGSQYGNTTLPSIMVSRFSNADGDFSTFTPAANKSTTIEWEIGVTQ
jgi:hypothetical protein